MSEQNCVLACGLGQGRLRAAIGRSFTTVRLAVPEISLLAAASRNFDRCTFHALPSSATGGGRLSERYLHQFRLAASDVSARCRLAVPEISLLAAALELSTAARFAPCLLPPQAAARRETPFESLSYQNKRALLRSARRIGIRSRLRARSGSALTCHRQVIHSRPVRIPLISKERSTSMKCFSLLAAE